jgi:RsiW-degrading membrane proteinase PrsW (M82 family)
VPTCRSTGSARRLNARCRGSGATHVSALFLALAGLGLLGGAIAGTAAGLRPARPVRFGPAFLVYLGVLAVVSTTWAQSMDALPLALVYGAAISVLPFGAAFLLARRLAGILMSKRTRE